MPAIVFIALMMTAGMGLLGLGLNYFGFRLLYDFLKSPEIQFALALTTAVTICCFSLWPITLWLGQKWTSQALKHLLQLPLRFLIAAAVSIVFSYLGAILLGELMNSYLGALLAFTSVAVAFVGYRLSFVLVPGPQGFWTSGLPATIIFVLMVFAFPRMFVAVWYFFNTH
jgi:hypothetical protein